MPYHQYIFGYSVWGGTLMIILWVIIMLLIIWAVTSGGRYRHYKLYHQHDGHWHNSGLDILNERYAKGEITKEEYEQKKKDISE